MNPGLVCKIRISRAYASQIKFSTTNLKSEVYNLQLLLVAARSLPSNNRFSGEGKEKRQQTSSKGEAVSLFLVFLCYNKIPLLSTKLNHRR
mmetsp:Transcript_12213/g.17908  ORF Transcript_12213/g.17908 Transcript_12213/m.17908 type:complete len:91 (+) Transcript_12213:1160-1432(+)